MILHCSADNELESMENERLLSWEKEQQEVLAGLLTQVQSHFEALNELFRTRQMDLVAALNIHFDKK